MGHFRRFGTLLRARASYEKYDLIIFIVSQVSQTGGFRGGSQSVVLNALHTAERYQSHVMMLARVGVSQNAWSVPKERM